MDLIVHTAGGGIQSVSGVTEITTCAQIIYSIAYATYQSGRFALIAKVNDQNTREHHFGADERPYEFVLEYSQKGIGVEFELRLLTEFEDCGTNENGMDRLDENDKPTIGVYVNSSLSTLNEYFNLQQQHTYPHHHIVHGKNRPPPPAYNELMAERCNSLRKGASLCAKPCPLTFLNIPNFSIQNLYSRSFSRTELEALLEIQQKTITAQKGELVRVELTLLNSSERELVQLQKQHNNLQTVLNSMRNSDLLKSYKVDNAEAERLHTAIAAMRTALVEKKRELHEGIQLQLTLEKQLRNELNRMGNNERSIQT